jgi:DNA ligase-1
LLPPPDVEAGDDRSLSSVINQLISIEKSDESSKKEFVVQSWKQMTKDERFVFNKLLTGNFRIGVSQKMIVNALAKTVKLEPSVIAHRISGNWDPATTSFEDLLSEKATSLDFSKPYPFYLAYALEDDPSVLGNEEEWMAEWKWDGIRGQLIKRNNEIFVWSRGEELMTEKFPEYHVLTGVLPEGVVLDGEIIPSIDKKPLPFALLQTRIGRKNVTKKHLKEAPIAFFAYDMLEYEGQDMRELPLEKRRTILENIVAKAGHDSLLISPVIPFLSWEELKQIRNGSRNMGAEGIMLKRKSSPYRVGRKVGDWWKWKIDPLVIDAVMIYAQKGHGRRSNLYTDYTFAVKDGDNLVSFAKAYSGLSDKEFGEVDSFVKRNSLEKFGPVRTVKPELVFEIAFEGIAASNRHKSGVALRFPRINRWRRDKKSDEINTLDDLKKMLEIYGK